MDTGTLHARTLFPAIGSIVMACLFFCPASAGDNVQIVPLCSDNRGNQAWVEIEASGTRMKATPFVATGGDGLEKLLENPDEKGSLAIPVPRLMRLVERARQAIRDMKRPAKNAPARPDAVMASGAVPAGSVGERRETTPDRTGLSAPAAKSATDLSPPASLCSTATR